MQSLKRRLLCVEDQHTCEVLDFLLGYSDYDYVLRAATTAAEGLALAQSEQFDLCLLDLRLPDGSGLELCRQIRSLHPHTPIVFYSTISHDCYRQQALSDGEQDYVLKAQRISGVVDFIVLVFHQPTSANTGKYRALAVTGAS